MTKEAATTSTNRSPNIQHQNTSTRVIAKILASDAAQNKRRIINNLKPGMKVEIPPICDEVDIDYLPSDCILILPEKKACQVRIEVIANTELLKRIQGDTSALRFKKVAQVESARSDAESPVISSAPLPIANTRGITGILRR